MIGEQCPRHNIRINEIASVFIKSVKDGKGTFFRAFAHERFPEDVLVGLHDSPFSDILTILYQSSWFQGIMAIPARRPWARGHGDNREHSLAWALVCGKGLTWWWARAVFLFQFFFYWTSIDTIQVNLGLKKSFIAIARNSRATSIKASISGTSNSVQFLDVHQSTYLTKTKKEWKKDHPIELLWGQLERLLWVGDRVLNPNSQSTGEHQPPPSTWIYVFICNLNSPHQSHHIYTSGVITDTLYLGS